MKKLVVFYSLEGNTKFIAQAIAQSAGADILELRPKKGISSSGFMKYFWGGKQVLTKEKPELLPLEKNPHEYDLIFIGTPVWASTFAPPLLTFFSEEKLRDKKIALFCTYGGNAGLTLEKMEEKLVGNEIMSRIGFKEPLKNNPEECADKAKEWAGGIV